MKLRPEVADDLRALEPVDRYHAVQALLALKAGTAPRLYRIEVMEPARALLKLDGLRALKCGDRVRNPLRIIFSDDAGAIEVLAVGPRQRSAVYLEAHYRLHPAAPPEPRLRHHDATDWEPVGGRFLT